MKKYDVPMGALVDHPRGLQVDAAVQVDVLAIWATTVEAAINLLTSSLSGPIH